MQEGEYHEGSKSHWMALSRLWLPWGRPTDHARLQRMRELFNKTSLERLQPIQVERMIGGDYRNMYMVHDGHHRAEVARERGIGLLPVRIWRCRGIRYDLMTTKCHLTFDRV